MSDGLPLCPKCGSEKVYVYLGLRCCNVPAPMSVSCLDCGEVTAVPLTDPPAAEILRPKED